MSALPPKADIRFTLRHVCFVPLTRRRFIAFLKGLENEGPHTELLIVGDTFGLWELTLVGYRKARSHHYGAPSHFRSTPSHRCAYQGHHDGRQSRLRPRLQPRLCGPAESVQHPPRQEPGPARREISASESRSWVMDMGGPVWNRLAVLTMRSLKARPRLP